MLLFIKPLRVIVRLEDNFYPYLFDVTLLGLEEGDCLFLRNVRVSSKNTAKAPHAT
jgi:hypothetical protein